MLKSKKMRWLVTLGGTILLVVSLLATGCAGGTPTAAPSPGAAATVTVTQPAVTVTATQPAATTAQYNWGFGLQYPLNTSYGIGSLALVDLIEKYSGGRIKIKMFAGGSRGNAQEIFEAIQKGDLEMGYTYAYGSYNPKLELTTIPLLPREYNKYLSFGVYNGLLSRITSDAWKEIGVKMLMTFGNRAEGVITKKGPIRTTADLKGMKIRSFGTTLPEVLTRMGAVAATLPSAEIYTGLQLGTIDGTIGDSIRALDIKAWEVTKYVSYIGVYAPAGVNIGMNLKLYNSLPADIKQAIDKAGHDAEIWQLAQTELDYWLADDQVKKQGMTVTYLTAAELKAFADVVKVEEIMDKYWAPIVGADLIAQVKQEIARIKAQY